MQTSFNFDASFALTLIGVLVLAVGVVIWSVRRNKRLRREEKRRARRAYKDWLAQSDLMAPPRAMERKS